MTENEYERPYAIWLKKSVRGKIDTLLLWMKNVTGRRIISASDSVRLLFRAWDSLTDKQKLKLLEGE